MYSSILSAWRLAHCTNNMGVVIMLAFEFNPTGHFNDDQSYLMEMIGILPHWLAVGDKSLPAKEIFDAAYDFGLFSITGGKIDDNGIFSYPEDPPLYPIAKVIRGKEIIYFYESAIVAIVSKDETFVTRMD